MIHHPVRHPRLRTVLMLALAVPFLSGCAAGYTNIAGGPTGTSAQAARPVAHSPHDAFLDRLRARCGQAFPGQLVTREAPDADMVGAAMVMHVRRCDADRVDVPFHIQRADGSWDRSRTWVFTRTAGGLRLKHDHRHEDGSEDSRTQYGGDTNAPGTAGRQDFPVDQDSIALFLAEGIPQSITNIWTVEIDDTRYAYHLRRTGEFARSFRVEFDLTQPVDAPPAPWGHE